MHVHQASQFLLLCDGAGCRERIALPDPATLADVLAHAAATGWIVRVLENLCPGCAKRR